MYIHVCGMYIYIYYVVASVNVCVVLCVLTTMWSFSVVLGVSNTPLPLLLLYYCTLYTYCSCRICGSQNSLESFGGNFLVAMLHV